MPGTLSTTNQSDSIISNDPNVPSDIKGNLLEWNGNNAHIDGLLFETGQHCVRHNIFIPLIENHAVLLSNGKRQQWTALQLCRSSVGLLAC